MASIQAIQAREILNSQGLPTIECNLWLDTGYFVSTSVPTSNNPGKNEAIELHDNQPERMVGRGVLEAVNNINNIIAPALVGHDPTQQTTADQLMIDLDGTANKEKLGANAILAVSQAVLKAGAVSVGMSLYYYLQQKYQLTDSLRIPTVIYSMLNGGAHGAQNLDLKDFSIIPASNLDYPTSLNMAVNFFHKLEEVLITKEAIHCVGKAGGFAPNLYSNTDALHILLETSKATPYTFTQDLFFGLDASAFNFVSESKYKLKDRAQPYTADELFTYYQNLRNSHQVTYFEDPFSEDDWKAWQKITAELGPTTNIVGDSLLVTSQAKVAEAIEKKACNGISIKPNQAGSISETIGVIKQAQDAGWKVTISHRSGETNDTFLADLAVGVGADFAKFGAPNRGERVAKYNRLLEIQAELEQLTAVQPADIVTNQVNPTTDQTTAATS